MKYLIHGIILFLFQGVSPLWSQQTVQVAPGQGTLEQAILVANPGDILQLTPGGTYTLSGEASTFGMIQFQLTIEAEPGSSQKAVLGLGPGASTTKKYYFFTINDGAALTLRGLDIHGLLNDTAVASSMVVVFDARPDPSVARIGNFRFEDCVFHDFKDYIVHGMKDDYARGLIQDSVFIDRVTVFNAKHFLQYKHVSLRHLEMTNTTVYSLQGMALKIGKIGYRCVLETPDKPYIPITDETITPTGYIDHCTLDDLGDIHGHIQVDNAYHLLTVSNCIISHQQQYDQPPVFFLEPAIDQCVSIQNTCFWDVGPPNADVGGSQWIGYQFLDTMITDPEYQDAANGNFALPDYSDLLTAATDGGQVGDLRWGTYSTAAVDAKKGPEPPDFYLSQNYPNPFGDATTFTYHMREQGAVSIRLYTVTGLEIATLVDEIKPAGTHTVTWEAGDAEKGVYFCRMQVGTLTNVRKIIHY